MDIKNLDEIIGQNPVIQPLQFPNNGATQAEVLSQEFYNSINSTPYVPQNLNKLRNRQKQWQSLEDD